jgi:uncharacterized lipoprotein YmbA
MRSMQIVVPAFVVVLIGLSCSSYLPTRYYVIDEEPPVVRASRTYPATMEVRSLRSPSRYKDQMVYRTSQYQVGFNEYSQWVEPPGEMVRRALTSALDRAQLFERVEPVGMITAPDLILQGSIVRFDQVIGKKGNAADCEIELEIIPMAGGKPIWKYVAKGMVEQEKEGAEGFVPGMSAAVDEAISSALAAMDASEELQKYIAEEAKPTATLTPAAEKTPGETPAGE